GSVSWAADAETLDIKTGLWETTTTMTMTGMPGLGPMPDYSKLPAAERAKREAEWKAAHTPEPETQKICITQETVDKDRLQSEDRDCTRTLVQKTRKVLRMRLICATEGSKGEGEFHYEALDRERIKGGFTMNSRATEGKKPIGVSFDMTGRWLSDD